MRGYRGDFIDTKQLGDVGEKEGGGGKREREREREREFLDAKPHPQPAIKHNDVYDVNSYYSCFALAPRSEA